MQFASETNSDGQPGTPADLHGFALHGLALARVCPSPGDAGPGIAGFLGASLLALPLPGVKPPVMPLKHCKAAQWQALLGQGAQRFVTRLGRMNLACVHCHEQNAGRQMRTNVVSPGQPTGFPVYRRAGSAWARWSGAWAPATRGCRPCCRPPALWRCGSGSFI